MNLRQAAQQALEALELPIYRQEQIDAAAALRAALAEPEQECDKDPRGCWSVRCQLGKKCKNAPTPRKALTDEEIDALVVQELGFDADADAMNDFARAIEAAHGIKEQEHE